MAKLYKFQNKHLGEFCWANVQPEEFETGLHYFKNNRIVELEEAGQTAGSLVYYIQGEGEVLKVFVSGFDSLNIHMECTCEHVGEDLCCHKVVALIHLDQVVLFSNIKPAAATPYSKSKKHLVVWPTEKMNQEDLLQHVKDQGLFEEDIDEYYLQVDDISSSEMVIVVSPGYYRMHERIRRIRVANHVTGVQLTCDCGHNFGWLCIHQAAVLQELIEDHLFPDVIIPEKRYALINKEMASYGLEGMVDPDDFMEFFVDKYGGIRYKVNEKYKGLLPVVDVDKGVLDSPFKRFLFPESVTKIDLPENPQEGVAKDEYVVGYALCVSSIDASFRVEPIGGKLNKAGNKMISNFIYYDDECEMPVTEMIGDADVMRICQMISPSKVQNYLKHKEVNWNDQEEMLVESTNYLFRYLPELFQLLSINDYAFLQKDKFYRFTKPRLKRSNLIELEYALIRAKLFYKVQEDELFLSVVPKIDVDGDEYDLHDNEIQVLNHLFIKCENTIYLMEDPHQALALHASFSSDELKVVKKMARPFLTKYIGTMSKTFDVRFEEVHGMDYEETKIRPIKQKLFISGVGNFVLFKPVVEYEKGLELELLRKGNYVKVVGNLIHKHFRDDAYETEFEQFFCGLHESFRKQFPQEFYHLKVNQMVDHFWFFDAFEKLREAGIEVYGLSELKNFNYHPYRASVSTAIKSGKDWFEVDLQVAFGDNVVNLADVKKALLRKERFIKLSDNSIGVLPEEWLQKFSKYMRFGEVKDGAIRISKRMFPVVEELFDEINDWEVIEELAQKKKMIEAFQHIEETEIPHDIEATLRDYQKEGLNWLNFLHQYRWGGILADDMGLGKTLQAITFLKKVSHGAPEPNLVVVPTTLIFNWENELKKFCPSLKAFFHYGMDRVKELSHFSDYDVVITTYGLLMNDIEKLKEVNFNYIILDESQAIKNPASKRYKAACLLKAQNRIAMTGTPIENNTFDLYAQMNFVNPGFLGSANHFREQFSFPIDRDSDRTRAAELQRMISPFVLRRTKEQVATELPPKTEDVIFCTMEEEQRKVYDAFRNKFRNQLMQKIEEDGLDKSKMHVLEGLLKLRQICDSPALLSGDENFGNDSVKIRELLRHITRKTDEHKIVVFSQFVGMLSLIRQEIIELGIDHEYLDGQSTQKQRQGSVERFQSEENCRLFLISLKAGGTGINLTAADYVFIVDPWWNPAVESQAIDRCYRIGQDKRVFAYRMICKNTIEERIIEYQRQKKTVAGDIIQTDESFMKQLDKKDIEDIFG